jgi:hypothetical protein
MLYGWVAATTVVILAIIICLPGSLWLGIFNQRAIFPVIYASDRQMDEESASVFNTGISVVDPWYLSYRRDNYRLFKGEMGTAWFLAKAYTGASTALFAQGRTVEANSYAALAQRIRLAHSLKKYR